MPHKTAGTLETGDTFLMAGGHYYVMEVRETSDPSRVQVVFAELGSDATNWLHYLKIRTDKLFITQ